VIDDPETQDMQNVDGDVSGEAVDGGDAIAGSTCPTCGELGTSGAQWCEACGASLDGEVGAVAGPPCVDCGAPHSEIIDDYCSECGRKQPGERDHLAEQIPGLAAVTDRGLRHHKNEDAFAIGQAGNALIAVVCDGVSTTDNPEDVSLAAAVAARDELVAEISAGETDISAALARSVDAAQSAAAAFPEVPGGEGPGATTFVAMVVRPSADGLVRSWTGWLGDSRAYWLHDGQATQLTVDDTWWREQVAEELLTKDEALADPRAQSITRWLGADAVVTTPKIQETEHDPGGRMLVCSDGLWKYVPDDSDVAEKIAELALKDPAELAEGLVAFALERGGHDNTTVIIGTPAMAGRT